MLPLRGGSETLRGGSKRLGGWNKLGGGTEIATEGTVAARRPIQKKIWNFIACSRSSAFRYQVEFECCIEIFV